MPIIHRSGTYKVTAVDGMQQVDSGAVVSLSLIFRRMLYLSQCKGFILFFGYSVFYMSLVALRIDWGYAFTTREHYERSRLNIDAINFAERTTVDQQVEFLTVDFDNLTTDLNKFCKDCDVSLTEHFHGLHLLSLKDFVCSDFDSQIGKNDYPTRNCGTDDAEYAATPRADSAPCCLNQTLVQASMSMMAWTKFAPELLVNDFLSSGPVNLGDLSEIDARLLEGPPNFGAHENGGLPEDKRQILENVVDRLASNLGSSVAAIVDEQFKSGKFPNIGLYVYIHTSLDDGIIGQVIISRNERMLGIECHATWLDHDNSPGIVVAKEVYWSYNFNAPGESAILCVLTVFFLASLAHEIFAYYGRNLTLAGFFYGEVLHLYFPFFLLSTFLVMIVETVRSAGALSVVDYIQWVSLAEAILLLRVVEEGKFLPSFRLAVGTIRHAARTLLNVMILALIVATVLAMMYGQQFGSFDSGLTLDTSGLARVAKMLFAPPSLVDAHLAQGKMGAVGLYYLGIFVMRLIFGSMFIAVTVGAFNIVRVKFARMDARLSAVPAGYTFRGGHKEIPPLTAASLAWFVVSGFAFGSFAPNLVRMCTKHTLMVRDLDFLGKRTSRWLQMAPKNRSSLAIDWLEAREMGAEGDLLDEKDLVILFGKAAAAAMIAELGLFPLASAGGPEGGPRGGGSGCGLIKSPDSGVSAAAELEGGAGAV